MRLAALFFMLGMLASACSRLAFVGPVGSNRKGSSPPSAAEAPSVGPGLTEEEVRSLLRGRHAVVVCGNDDSVGFSVAEGLAEVGAHVVLGCLRHEKAQAACDHINEMCKRRALAEGLGKSCGGNVLFGSAEARYLDLSTPTSVWRFADTLLAENRPLHVFVGCSDDSTARYSTSKEEGWEKTVGTTHLGPFLLCQLLLDRMMETMKQDAAAFALGNGRYTRQAAKPRSKRQRIEAIVNALEQGPTSELKARPHPSPFGRVVALGLEPRLSNRRITPIDGLFLCRSNYSSRMAYRAAHEANLLSNLQVQVRATTACYWRLASLYSPIRSSPLFMACPYGQSCRSSR